MELPAHLTLNYFTYALDGGTTVLQGIDESGLLHEVTLVQHIFPNGNTEEIPGRLYFDNVLISMRSELEARILSLLHNAEVRYDGPLPEDFEGSPEENIREMLNEVVSFVESGTYLRFAELVEQAQDPTRYTARILWEPSHRKQTIISLGQILGVGVRAARDLIDHDTPIAENISALEVSELMYRVAAAGMTLRVDPPFRFTDPK